MGFSSLPFTANLVPEWPAVLISTDDFLRLKRGFATDGQALETRRKSQAAADDRGYNSLWKIPLTSRSKRDPDDRSIHPRKARSQPSSNL